MTESKMLLGIDAGGSFTDLALSDRSGRTIESTRCAGANPTTLGIDEACRVLADGLGDVLRQSGTSAEAVGVVVLGVAGIDREPQRSAVQRWLAGALPAARALVVTDVELVIAAGTPAGIGLGIVSGTGSVALAWDTAGRMVKVGGRGPVEGDPGSGHAIGLAAIRTGRFRALSDAARDVAALVPEVVAAADVGDRDAADILQAAGHDLADQAAEAITRMGWAGTTVPCALGGGVVVNVAAVRDSFVASARARDLSLEPLTLVARPVEGAIRLARTIAAANEDRP